MSFETRSEQQHLAQKAYDAQLPSYSDLDLDELADEQLSDPAVLREIASNELPYTLPETWFTEATEALIQLGTKDADALLGSQLLIDLYSLAKSARAAAMEIAREQAQEALDARQSAYRGKPE